MCRGDKNILYIRKKMKKDKLHKKRIKNLSIITKIAMKSKILLKTTLKKYAILYKIVYVKYMGKLAILPKGGKI